MIKVHKHTKHSSKSMRLEATTRASLTTVCSVFPEFAKAGLDIERVDRSSGEALLDIRIFKDGHDIDEALMTLWPNLLSCKEAARVNSMYVKIRRRRCHEPRQRGIGYDFDCTITFPHDTNLGEYAVTFSATRTGFNRFDVRTIAARALQWSFNELEKTQPTADAVETLDELRAAKLDAYTGLLGRVCSTFSAES